MDSTIFNRRTLLGSGALVGLGALLAACGQQANNEAAATALPRRANRLRLLLRRLTLLLHQLLRARSLPVATRAVPRRPMESTVRQTAKVPLRMFLFRKQSRNNTLRLKKASTA